MYSPAVAGLFLYLELHYKFIEFFLMSFILYSEDALRRVAAFNVVPFLKRGASSIFYVYAY